MGFFSKAGKIADKGIKKTKNFFEEIDNTREKSRLKSLEAKKIKLQDLKMQKKLEREEEELEKIRLRRQQRRGKGGDGLFGDGDLFGRGGF